MWALVDRGRYPVEFPADCSKRQVAAIDRAEVSFAMEIY